jgi:hypothetical protein
MTVQEMAQNVIGDAIVEKTREEGVQEISYERHLAFQAYLSDYVWRQTLAGCKGCHTSS